MIDREQVFATIDAEILRAASVDEQLALLAIHVHGLRGVSLRFGYEQGELAADSASTLIGRILRPIDRIFRTGADTFLALLPGMHNTNHALLAANRLTSAFASPLNVGAMPWHGRSIVGIAVYPDHGDTAERLRRHAEIAHDEAQRRNEPYAIYQQQQSVVDISYEDLYEAIKSNKLRTYFQPVWDLRSRRLVGVESLARWTSEHHGAISPDQFVTLAEQSDLISHLTRWSINATLRHANALRRSQEMSFAINFSPRVFNESGLVEQLIGALDIWGVPPTSVIAEVTETALVNDLELSVRVLKRMRDHGIRIAIDDFGSGYASFSYLSRFPATELKIDKSFVAGMLQSRRETQLVRAMIDMAHHLDLLSIAEGIEDQATQDLLTDMGCDLAQGYHLGRPEAAELFVTRFSATPPVADSISDAI